MITRRQTWALARENAKYPLKLQPLERAAWPARIAACPDVFAAWRSRGFLVIGYNTSSGLQRLTINRTDFDLTTGRFRDGITWDELQRLKAEAGFGDRFAVEVFPADVDVVNVSNLRHLWLLPEPPAYAWRNDTPEAARA